MLSSVNQHDCGGAKKEEHENWMRVWKQVGAVLVVLG